MCTYVCILVLWEEERRARKRSLHLGRMRRSMFSPSHLATSMRDFSGTYIMYTSPSKPYPSSLLTSIKLMWVKSRSDGNGHEKLLTKGPRIVTLATACSTSHHACVRWRAIFTTTVYFRGTRPVLKNVKFCTILLLNSILMCTGTSLLSGL